MFVISSSEVCLAPTSRGVRIRPDVTVSPSVSLTRLLRVFTVQLDNLTLMEINTIRSFLLDSLNCMYKLRSNLQPGSRKDRADY